MSLVLPVDKQDLIFEEIVGLGDYVDLPSEFLLTVNKPQNQGDSNLHL